MTKPSFADPTPDDKKVEKVALCWRVAEVADEGRANMRLDHVKVSLIAHIAAEPESLLAARRKADARLKSKQPAAQASTAEDLAAALADSSYASAVVRIPVLVNHKDLLDGDALLVYKPAAQKKEEPVGQAVDKKRLFAKALEETAGKKSKKS